LSNGIVSIQLTRAQAELLAPLIQQSVGARTNILFVSTVAPHIDPEGETTWQWQVVRIESAQSGRVVKAIRAATLGSDKELSALADSQP
jgi:hypothetical protein